ncbi:MAG: hypothetical protein LBT46_10485 [Planctomycetaceae bacterium]|nr:hypothetical protein [Planctomycetaceae bacterium]
MKIVLSAVFGIAALGAVCLFAGGFSLTPKEAVDPRFAAADTDKNGKLDHREFEEYLVRLNRMKIVKVPDTASAGECSGSEKETASTSSGNYMESALGYSYVPVKSATEKPMTKEGGCCGKMKMKEAEKTGSGTETASMEKSGGCCGKKE